VGIFKFEDKCLIPENIEEELNPSAEDEDQSLIKDLQNTRILIRQKFEIIKLQEICYHVVVCSGVLLLQL